MSKPKRPRTESPSVLTGEQRINKLLAASGLGSRRQVDELIADGRVEIDGKTVTQVGVKVDADTAKISVDGEALKRHRPLYFAVHKPAGVLCTNSDPEGRPRVIDLVPGHNRLFPVGRLDSSSTGLILLTNDGELAQRLAHPRNSVPKTYHVVVAGQVEMDSMRRLQRGIYLAEGFARVDGAKIRRVRKGCTEIEITLSEGKNREIRRVLARLGHKVITLRRLAIGPLRLATLPEGSYRPLSQEEVSHLYNAVEEIKREKKVQRNEKDRLRSAEMNGVGVNPSRRSGSPQPDNPEVDRLEIVGKTDSREPAKMNVAKTKKKSKRDHSLDTLPPLSENPYSEAEDQEPEDSGFKDSVLVKNSGISLDEKVRRGKVISYSDDDQGAMNKSLLDDDYDTTGMGFENFDDDDDDDDDLEGSESGEGGEEEIEVSRSPGKKPQQSRSDSSSNRSLRSNKFSTSKGSGGESTPSFTRKKGTGRPTGPNSGQRGQPNSKGRTGSSPARKSETSSRPGVSTGRPSSRPSKSAARTGSGFGGKKTSVTKKGFGGGNRSAGPAKKKDGGSRSFGGPKGRKSDGKGRSPGKRG